MIIILSCAKRQKEGKPSPPHSNEPVFYPQAQEWIQRLAAYTPQELTQLLAVSPAIALLNYHRYRNALTHPEHARPALDTFDGDVYQAMGRSAWSQSAWEHAHKHLRIISGLYGYLRPDDTIVPYRLEMQTRLPWIQGSLAHYWQEPITTALNNESAHTVINLASQEYAHAVDRTKLLKHWIDIVFWDKKKDNTYGVIGLRSKKARGHMIDALCTHGWTSPEDLKKFTRNYCYNPSYSTEKTWVFTCY